MLAQVLLIASLPSMFCAGCAAFLPTRNASSGSGSPGYPYWPASAAIAVLNMIGLWRLAGH